MVVKCMEIKNKWERSFEKLNDNLKRLENRRQEKKINFNQDPRMTELYRVYVMYQIHS